MKKWKQEFMKEYQIEDEITRGTAEYFFEAGWTKAIVAIEERLKQEERKVDNEQI